MHARAMSDIESPHTKQLGYLFVIPWDIAHPGGVNQVVLGLAREMKEVGRFVPIILMTDWSASKPIFGDFDGILTVRWRVRWLPAAAALWPRLLYALWIPGFALGLLRLVRRYRIACINLHFPELSGYSIYKVLRLTREKAHFVVSFHGSEVNRLMQRSQRERAHWRRFLDGIDANVVCSAALGAELRSALGDTLRVEVVHNGIDPRQLTGPSIRRSQGDRGVILSVGKFVSLKGQSVLLESFIRIANEYPDLSLVIVGANGDCFPALQRRVQEAGLSARVTLIRDVIHADMASYFQRANFFVLPSIREGFPIVLLEAGLFQLPVIASRVGGIPELLDHRENGILVTPSDVEELTLSLIELLRNPHEADSLAKSLHDRVMNDFTWSVAYAKYEAILKKLLH